MKKSKKRFIVTAVAVVLGVLTLSSASVTGGQIRLDDRMLIQGIGIDRIGEEVLVSVHISEPSEKETVLEQLKGDTVLAALDQLVQRSGKVPLYSHNLVVVLGRSCGEQGLERDLDFFVRYYETRPSVAMFLAQNTAKEIFEYQENGKYLKAEEIAHMGQGGKSNGWTVYTRVIDFVNQLWGEGSSPYLPEIGVREGEVEITGTAVLEGDVYRTTLSPEESRVLLLITKRLSGGQMTTQLSDVGKVTVTIRGATATVQQSIGENGPEVQVEIQCRTELSSMEDMQMSADQKLILRLEEQFEQEMQKTAEDTIKKVTRLPADPFGFGRQLMQEQTAWWKENGKDWKTWLKMLPVKVTAQVDIEPWEE